VVEPQPLEKVRSTIFAPVETMASTMRSRTRVWIAFFRPALISEPARQRMIVQSGSRSMRS